MRGWMDKMVPPALHSWDLPRRSVLSIGSRPIPGEQILDVKAPECASAAHQGQCLVPGIANISRWVSAVPSSLT